MIYFITNIIKIIIYLLIRLHEKFRIYVVIPLFPGFNSFNALHAVLFFIMCSIAKGDNSLFSRLIQAGNSFYILLNPFTISRQMDS